MSDFSYRFRIPFASKPNDIPHKHISDFGKTGLFPAQHSSSKDMIRCMTKVIDLRMLETLWNNVLSY